MFILLFLIFDLEAVFLLPWALSYDGLGLGATIAVAIFVGLLMLEFAYAWKRGLLTWTR
jgi:NADH-quinone oxidoreductase subunit A